MAEYRAGAAAKLNLYLHVTGQREDGYHTLNSLVAFARVGDRITARTSGTFSLTLSGPMAKGLSKEDNNLVLRAALLLAKAAKLKPTAALNLHKVLPIASGIGGGSADAAATLRVLSKLWNLNFSDRELTALGLRLGADLPVCLAARPMFMDGIGDRLVPAPPLPPASVVLVNPGLPLSTPAVFHARQGAFSEPAPFVQSPTTALELAQLLKQRRNDLEKPALLLAPVIADVLALLDSQPDCLLARMSGSGATCFGLFATIKSAQAAAARIAAAKPRWWTAAAPLMSPLEPFDGTTV
ncbi:4-(cytidine 5'-diphospho)-2-C-methyl-D-erythritol kinase [Magnetospira thiophila]